MFFKEQVNYFLHIYFFLLEEDLNTSSGGLEKVKFQSEEANTDEFVKLFFKEYISRNNKIPKNNINELVVKSKESTSSVPINDLSSLEIINVFIPEELDETKRDSIAKSKTSVYTNPDLYLEISDSVNTHFESIELKSTKNNNIPGSSVQQVTPFEWVIFVKHGDGKAIVTTGHYINSITEKLPFPDRSPRPQIGFKTLVDWNKENRTVAEKSLSFYIDEEVKLSKIKLLDDWQDFLADEWLSIVKSEEFKTNEKWFNNALRKFSVKFLQYAGTLSKEEQEKLIANLNSLIK